MKWLIKIFLIVITLNQALITYSQPLSITDSLYKKLENTHIAHEKVDVYINLINHLIVSDPKKAADLANHALILAQRTEDISSLGLIYASLGELALLEDSIKSGELYLKKAAEYLNKANNYNKLITVYLSIGNMYIGKDNYAEAMKSYIKGIEIAKKNNDKSKLPNLYNNLGIVYLNIDKPEKALELYSTALKLFEEKNDTISFAGTTTNIGSIYINLGQFDIAEKYYRAGYRLFKESGNMEGLAHSLLKLGYLDLNQKQYDSAFIHLSRSLKIQRALEVTVSGSKSFFLSETLINLGISLMNLNKSEDAIDYLLEGYEIARNTNQYRLTALSSENLSSIYEDENKPHLALKYNRIFKQYSDSNYNAENIRKLTQIEMQHQFNTRLKEDELKHKIKEERQERRNLVNIIISGGLFFLLIIAALLLRLEKTRKRKAELEKTNLSSKLEQTNKELTTHVMYLLRKNEFIIRIAEKLKLAKLEANSENKKVISELIKELESNSTMVSWEEFEIRFQEVYTGFYKNLNLRFPDLTPNELRLCAFFRLNMTTKEIAAITYQTTNSIVVARYRLRKKLGLEKEENLVSFLSKI